MVTPLPTEQRRLAIQPAGVTPTTRAQADYFAAQVERTGVTADRALERIESQTRQAATLAGLTDGVARDPQGRLTFRPRLDATIAAEAYNRAGELVYMDSVATDLKGTAGRLALEHENDPVRFQATFEAYAREVAENADPMMAPMIQVKAVEIGGQTFNHLTAAKAERDRRAALEVANRRVGEAMGEIAALVRQGADDAAALKAAEFQLWVGQSQEAGLFDAAQVDELHDALRATVATESLLARVDELYATEGQEATLEAINAFEAAPQGGLAPDEARQMANLARARLGTLQQQANLAEATRATALAARRIDMLMGVVLRQMNGETIPEAEIKRLMLDEILSPAQALGLVEGQRADARQAEDARVGAMIDNLKLRVTLGDPTLTPEAILQLPLDDGTKTTLINQWRSANAKAIAEREALAGLIAGAERNLLSNGTLPADEEGQKQADALWMLNQTSPDHGYLAEGWRNRDESAIPALAAYFSQTGALPSEVRQTLDSYHGASPQAARWNALLIRAMQQTTNGQAVLDQRVDGAALAAYEDGFSVLEDGETWPRAWREIVQAPGPGSRDIDVERMFADVQGGLDGYLLEHRDPVLRETLIPWSERFAGIVTGAPLYIPAEVQEEFRRRFARNVAGDATSDDGRKRALEKTANQMAMTYGRATVLTGADVPVVTVRPVEREYAEYTPEDLDIMARVRIEMFRHAGGTMVDDSALDYRTTPVVATASGILDANRRETYYLSFRDENGIDGEPLMHADSNDLVRWAPSGRSPSNLRQMFIAEQARVGRALTDAPLETMGHVGGPSPVAFIDSYTLYKLWARQGFGETLPTYEEYLAERDGQ